jgi:hypothetical protein
MFAQQNTQFSTAIPLLLFVFHTFATGHAIDPDNDLTGGVQYASHESFAADVPQITMGPSALNKDLMEKRDSSVICSGYSIVGNTYPCKYILSLSSLYHLVSGSKFLIRCFTLVRSWLHMHFWGFRGSHVLSYLCRAWLHKLDNWLLRLSHYLRLWD